MTPRVLIAPGAVPADARDAVLAGGGVLVDRAEDADLIVWTAPTDPTGLPALLAAAPVSRSSCPGPASSRSCR